MAKYGATTEAKKAISYLTDYGWVIRCDRCHYRDIRAEEHEALEMAAAHNGRKPHNER